VTVTQQFSVDENFGLIIGQEPPVGSFGPQSGNVAIVLSKGSAPVPRARPSVRTSR
jgi:hypothetical protein